MERQIGAAGPQQPGHPDVLDEHRIDPTGRHLPGQALEFPEFPVEGQGVERGVAAKAVAVEGFDDPGEVGDGEIRRPNASVVAAVEAKIDGVGPIFDRRADAVPIPRRGEEFGGWDGGGSGELAGHAGRV